MTTARKPLHLGANLNPDTVTATVLQVRGKVGDVVFQDTDPRFADGDSPSQPRRLTRAYVPHHNSQSPAQLYERQIFIDAVALWQQAEDFIRQIYAEYLAGDGTNAFLPLGRTFLSAYHFWIADYRYSFPPYTPPLKETRTATNPDHHPLKSEKQKQDALYYLRTSTPSTRGRYRKTAKARSELGMD